MIIHCPYCHRKEVIGTLFCSECGTLLTSNNPDNTPMIQRNSTPDSNQQVKESLAIASSPVINQSGVSLLIMDSGQTIPLEGQVEYTLGRNSEGQSVISDIDLTPFRGYELGVSRLHTSINIDNVSATDLGSANGTRINGEEIPSFTPHHLNHGDIITLGKLKIQILIHR